MMNIVLKVLILSKDVDKVTAKLLNEYSYTTRRNYFSAIITLLQSEEKPDKDLINKYTDYG